MVKLDMKGKQLNTGRTHFKKGHVPWNKGKKNVQKFSKEWRQAQSERIKQKWQNPKYRAKQVRSKLGNKNTLGYKQSKKTIEKRIKSGKEHYNWKGGISFEKYSLNWTATLRRSIRERDKYVCRLCNKQQSDRAFCVHHIDYDKKNNNPNNLITLCISCYIKTNYNREYWIKYFS